MFKRILPTCTPAETQVIMYKVAIQVIGDQIFPIVHKRDDSRTGCAIVIARMDPTIKSDYMDSAFSFIIGWLARYNHAKYCYYATKKAGRLVAEWYNASTISSYQTRGNAHHTNHMARHYGGSVLCDECPIVISCSGFSEIEDELASVAIAMELGLMSHMRTLEIAKESDNCLIREFLARK